MLQLLIAEAEQDRGIYAGRVVSGIGIGGISAVSLAYVSECSPKEVRGRTIGLLMVSRATGAVVSYLVNRRPALSFELSSQTFH